MVVRSKPCSRKRASAVSKISRRVSSLAFRCGTARTLVVLEHVQSIERSACPRCPARLNAFRLPRSARIALVQPLRPFRCPTVHGSSDAASSGGCRGAPRDGRHDDGCPTPGPRLDDDARRAACGPACRPAAERASARHVHRAQRYRQRGDGAAPAGAVSAGCRDCRAAGTRRGAPAVAAGRQSIAVHVRALRAAHDVRGGVLLRAPPSRRGARQHDQHQSGPVLYPAWAAWWRENAGLSRDQWVAKGFADAGLHVADPVDERFALELMAQVGGLVGHLKFNALYLLSRSAAIAPQLAPRGRGGRRAWAASRRGPHSGSHRPPRA